VRLRGRRVLVTGAASGIGLAIARLFRREGAGVAMLDRDEAALGKVRVDGASGVVCDVADERQVRAAVAQAASALGGLDGIVNSAGIDLMRPFEQMTAEEWGRVMAVDLTGPMLVCHAALPAMKQAGRGMFGKTLAVDLAADHIRVNAICPGIIDTPLFRSSWEGAADPEGELARILDRYVIKRAGEPDEIAQAALYLTSDESSFVTGAALAVDGGRTFH
jgi:NAD(P)-dependent dehydrogenase (short-subunit alcohol dehydrogenase family)